MKQGDMVKFWTADGYLVDIVYAVFQENGWDLVKTVTGEVFPVDQVVDVAPAWEFVDFN